MGDVFQQPQLPVAPLGVDDTLEGTRELLHGHALLGHRVLSRATEGRERRAEGREEVNCIRLGLVTHIVSFRLAVIFASAHDIP